MVARLKGKDGKQVARIVLPPETRRNQVGVIIYQGRTFVDDQWNFVYKERDVFEATEENVAK